MRTSSPVISVVSVILLGAVVGLAPVPSLAAGICTTLAGVENELQALTLALNAPKNEESKTPEEIFEAHDFQLFKSEAINFLFTQNRGNLDSPRIREKLLGLRVALWTRKAGYVVGEVMDVWSERSFPTWGEPSVSLYFSILDGTGNLQTVSFDTTYGNFDGPIWRTKTQRSTWEKLRETASPLRAVAVENLSRTNNSTEFWDQIKASVVDPKNWIDFNSPVVNRSHSELVGFIVAGKSGNVFSGLVTHQQMIRGNAGGYDDYIYLRISPLDGSAPQTISVSTYNGRINSLFVFQWALNGQPLVKPSADGVRPSEQSKPSGAQDYRGPLF